MCMGTVIKANVSKSAVMVFSRNPVEDASVEMG